MEFRPLTTALGAEAVDLDITAPLTDVELDEVYDALVTHKVLLIHAPGLTPDQHMAFGRRMGEIEIHAFFPNLGDGYEHVSVLDSAEGNVASLWHTDETFLPAPPLGTLTWAKVMPPFGGDTLWANTEMAYDALSPNMKAYLDDLTAVHDLSRVTELRARFGGATVEQLGAAIAEGRRTAHPIVRIHPETGRRGLFVNPTYTRHIVGLPPDESDLILGFLYQHSIKEQFTFRHSWREGDLLMWDNRSTMHRVLADFDGPRVMHRVSVVGRSDDHA